MLKKLTLPIRQNPDAKLKSLVLSHIDEKWLALERHNVHGNGSLVGLPNPYIVPGGSFEELYYWDSYFVMLGLAATDKWQLIEGMIRNFTYLIDKLGHIPNANYGPLLTRSQPPYLSHMIELLAQGRGDQVYIEYLPYLRAEYDYWMHGTQRTSVTEPVSGHVVRTPSGVLLNRYHDASAGPRSEEAKNDLRTANHSGQQSTLVFPHIRAACESGWDFSSRWFADPFDKSSMRTAHIIPVDLNCLLYHLETTIAKAAVLSGDTTTSRAFAEKAAQRSRAIGEYCWNDRLGFYDDYDYLDRQHTGRMTLAGVYPLLVGVADRQRAKRVASKLKADFLQPGGLVTTLHQTGEQWDAPNGWAPLQYGAIIGLRKYGYHRLAVTIKHRWIKTNVLQFAQHGKLFEKYDVVRPNQIAGGGEYPLQEGFGWTNGVLAALMLER